MGQLGSGTENSDRIMAGKAEEGALDEAPLEPDTRCRARELQGRESHRKGPEVGRVWQGLGAGRGQVAGVG